MNTHEEESEIEATAEQLDELRELGVSTEELQGLSVADAEELIARMRAEREVGW